MAPTYKSVPIAPAVKGCIASTDYATQPKGSYPRLSNFLTGKRGALDVCDGTQLLHVFNGQVQTTNGKIMENFLFAPTGVSSYYLSIQKTKSIFFGATSIVPLGAPQNLTSAVAAGGSLTSGTTYFYKVTALDGAGGETTTSNETSATPAGGNLSVTLTWNIVPNAQTYNVYRSTTTGTEQLLYAVGLPAAQVSPGTLTVSFTDNGSGSTSPVFPLSSILFANVSAPPSPFTYTYAINLATPQTIPTPITAIITGTSNATLNGNTFDLFVMTSPTSGGINVVIAGPLNPAFETNATGGNMTVQPVSPPGTDSTQQTALYKMPVLTPNPAVIPSSYGTSNIVALYPADNVPVPSPGGGGGSGGGGGTGGGGSPGGSGGGQAGPPSTPSGGVSGNVSLIPQMVQFTNRVAIALGNGFPPQLYSDPNTTVNPATVAAISAISVDAFGVVTVTTSTPHGLTTAQVGANVLIAGVTNALYNYVGPTIQIVSTTQYKVRNLAAIGQAASSGGTSTTTSVPIISTFVPAFPTWSATTAYSVNSIVQPSPTNGHFYKAVQGGTSGAAQPTFPTTTGQQVSDGSIIWQEAGLTNTAAPPPPGAGHVFVYAGSLWWWNTSPTNTSTGLDGPCSLRMSDVNNPNSYNPLNQAFLDKDDGTEGMGLQSFTISAQGIPPEGSLVAFKNYSCYQIIGVFGSSNLAIQRIKSNMGNLAPRSLQFVPGFGLVRFAHLGYANFDGVEDRVISEDIRPFLFPSNDTTDSDITVMDANWQSIMWGFQTAQPPMYCAAIPIGNSQSELQRILCFDMVLKAWLIVDLPWTIGTASQFVSTGANPVTVFGGFIDGALSRWQAGDAQWDTGANGIRFPTNIAWSLKIPEAVSQDLSQKLNCRRVALRGVSSGFGAGQITVTPVVNGVSKPSQKYTIPSSGDWEVFASFMYDGLRFSAIVSGKGQIEWNRPAFHISPKEVGAAEVVA